MKDTKHRPSGKNSAESCDSGRHGLGGAGRGLRPWALSRLTATFLTVQVQLKHQPYLKKNLLSVVSSISPSRLTLSSALPCSVPQEADPYIHQPTSLLPSLLVRFSCGRPQQKSEVELFLLLALLLCVGCKLLACNPLLITTLYGLK